MMLAKRQNLGLINCSSCQFGIESNCTLPEVQQKQCKSIPEKCYVNKQNPKPECLACFYQGDNEAECLRCFPILGNVEPGCEGWSPSVNPTSSSNSIYPQETGTAPSSQPNGPSPTQSFPSKDSAGPKTGSPNVQNAEPAQDGSKGLGSGAVAGVAIGCLLAGAAVAALVLLLLFRRHRKRQTLYNGTPGQLVAHHVGPLHQEKGVGAAAGAAALKDGVTVTATDLPQPAEDDAITGQMSMLRDKIKNHAQSYYHVMPVDPVTVSEAPLGGFARGTGLAPATIKEFLCNPQSRQAMIRSYLSWETLSRCGAQGDSDASLLPAEVASFVSSFSAQVAPDSRAVSRSSHWKVVSADLLRKQYQQRGGKPTARPERIAEAVAAANAVLAPFVNGHVDAAQRARNLESLFARAADFAFLLFAQPSAWRFDWRGFGRAGQHGGLVVLPALQQVADDRGEVLPVPRVFYDMEVL